MIDRPLRFCMVTTFYPPFNFGGDGVFVHRLSNELAKRGHRVDVIHCVDAYQLLAARPPATGYDDHPNVTVHGLKSPFGFLSPLATQQTGAPLFKATKLREILDSGFDVIHYHNISLVGGPGILRYGRGIKLYTVHEYWLVCPTHILFRFKQAACTRPLCFACTLSYGRPPQWWRYLGGLNRAARHVDAFLAPSRFTQAIHRTMGFDRPMVHLPLFVPGGESPPADDPALSETPYFLFVGRLEKLKGLQTLIPLFRAYAKAQLWVAGAGSDEAMLRELAAGSSNIRFLGYRSHGELRALYRRAVAVLVPSLCYEVFPLVVLEGFSERTPAIVRRLGALAEFIEDSGGGFAYARDEELVDAMDRLVADPRERQALGLRGHQAYLKYWTVEAHLERYLTLIRELAEARGPRTTPHASP